MLRYLALVIPLALCAPLHAESKKGIEGLWYGALKVGALELRMGFKIETKDGKLVASLDSVDQGARSIPAESAEFADGQLTIKMPKLKATYSGKLQADGDSIVGELDQGEKMKLDLKRTDKAPAGSRPQDPKKPYPYDEELLTFDSKAKDVKLAGTFTKPKGEGPFPAVVLISGSGPQDRNEELLGHKPFLVLADHLTRKGIAVLRYDDRGVGKSTGKFDTATSKDFAEDAAGAVAFLKTRKEVGKIGLMGHSEGGLIAPMVAVENSDVAFIVLLAGPGLPGDEIIVAQSALIAKAMGMSEKDLVRQKAALAKLIPLAKEGADAEKFKAALKELEKDLNAEEKKELEKDRKTAEAQLMMFASPWFRFFLSHDPRPTLGKVKCPLLAINGELDLQVPCKENLAAVESALKSHGNKDVTVKEFPGLNHLFQETKTGLPSEYGKIDETFSPKALNVISEWILKRK